MKLEHVAIMVREPANVAAWYVHHLGLRIIRKQEQSPFIHFLADDSGQSLIEIYNNPLASVPDYRAMHPLQFHLAFSCADLPAERARLLAAGATAEGEPTRNEAGDVLAMLRDPWGVPVQLACRSRPMV